MKQDFVLSDEEKLVFQTKLLHLQEAEPLHEAFGTVAATLSSWAQQFPKVPCQIAVFMSAHKSNGIYVAQ